MSDTPIPPEELDALHRCWTQCVEPRNRRTCPYPWCPAPDVLVNERGNTIAVDAKRGPSPDEITLRIVGPSSESTNVVTEQEARAIYRALGHVLDL